MKPISLPSPQEITNYGSIDPLDSRYFDIEASRFLSEASQIAYQAFAEAALAHTLADFNICSRKIAREIEAATKKVTPEQIYQEEKTTHHNIKALVNSIKHFLSDEAKPYVHFGATSYDIISSASALQYKNAVNQLIIPRLKSLLGTFFELSEKYAETPQIGRTHGQHAIPITFGFAMAEYVNRIGENITKIEQAAGELTGKFSGAVGAYNSLSVFVGDPIKFERTFLGYLEIEPALHSTQITPPEQIIRLIDELVISAGIMANLANDMRHLQRSEIAEVRERFEKGQTGSSTMAHKRNPLNFENVVSMSKQVASQMLNAHLNIGSEHQRDLTDSASSRFYPLVFASVASMARRLRKIMAKIEVDEENMRKNLYLTKGAIAAEPFYLLLEKHGHTSAHEKSKELAHAAIERNKTLQDVIQSDSEAAAYWERFSPKEKKIIIEPEINYSGLAAKKARTIIKKWQKIAPKS